MKRRMLLLPAARTSLEGQNPRTAETLVVADGAHDTAAVFEVSGIHPGVREIGECLGRSGATSSAPLDPGDL